jgi:hypothetical protein
VRASIAEPAIVALSALALAVARHATSAIDARSLPMIYPKICVMLHAQHPRRWVKYPFGKMGSEHAVSLGQMAVIASLRGARALMARDTLAHGWKVKPRR